MADPPPPPPSLDRQKLHNLTDPKYCCVWGVEVYENAPRSSDVRNLLQRAADAVAPVLRYRGWRVKRLCESVSRTAAGLCTTNGRADADATSCVIQINVRTTPDKSCRTLRSYQSVLAIMLHEITHISIGLEDIHPPAFYDLMRENRRLCESLKGEVVDTRGGRGVDDEILDSDKRVMAADVGGADEEEEEEFTCGQKKKRVKKSVGIASAVGMKAEEAGLTGKKRPPLLKGSKMVDGRSKAAKVMIEQMTGTSKRQLASEAALRRFAPTAAATASSSSSKREPAAEVIDLCDSDSGPGEEEGEEEEEEEGDEDGENGGGGDHFAFSQHASECECRPCTWDRELCGPQAGQGCATSLRVEGGRCSENVSGVAGI